MPPAEGSDGKSARGRSRCATVDVGVYLGVSGRGGAPVCHSRLSVGGCSRIQLTADLYLMSSTNSFILGNL